MEAPHFNPASVLSLLGVVQALLLALALVTTKRGNRTANLLLAGFAVNIAILVSGHILITTRYIELFPHFSRVSNPFDYTAAPLLYLYIRELISDRPGLKRKDLLHFIPSALCFIYLIPYYFQSSDAKLYDISSAHYARWYLFRVGLALLLALVYLVFIALRLAAYARAIKTGRLPVQRSALFRLRFIAITFVAVWVLAALRYVIDLRFPGYKSYTTLILPLSATFIVYAMAYISLRRPQALIGAEELREEGDAAPLVKKYEKSSLTPERAERYLKKLLDLMEREKPYLDSDLTIQKLAEQLMIPAPHLSQTINERLNQNFSDMVNSYRIEEAKRLLLDPKKKHYSILAIAEEVGFNSKSSFNAVFKKFVNATPSEWRKAVNGDDPQPHS